MVKILVIDDNPDDRLLTIRELEREFSDLFVWEINDRNSFTQVLEADEFNLAIVDYQLRWTTGIEILREIKLRDPDRPVVMFTNTGSQEIAVEAMKSGLDDYVLKSPKHFIRLRSAVRAVWERSQMKRKADKLEFRLHSLLERLSLGVFRATPDGRLLETNSAFLHLLGVTSLEALQGALVEPLLLGRDGTLGEKEKRQVQLARPDGSQIWVEVKETLIDLEGETVIDGSIEDISDRKQAQQAIAELAATLEQRVMERTAELAEVNEELKTFAYSVSHDLQEPLRGIEGFARALRQDCGERLDARCLEYVERIESASERLNGMIEDLLNYSLISSTELTLQPIELDSVVNEALTRLDARIRDRNAQVRVERPLLSVQGHYSTLVQIAINLLANAIKFVDLQQVPQVRVWTQERGDWVQLWVSDNGIGIAPENHKRIFRVFERLHGIESYSGNGIGLALVRKGVERLGGRVGVESQRDRGSRFWIELPKEPTL